MISPERHLTTKAVTIKNADNFEAHQIIDAASRIPTNEVICILKDSTTGETLATTIYVPSLNRNNGTMDTFGDMIGSISNHSNKVITETTVRRRRVEAPQLPEGAER